MGPVRLSRDSKHNGFTLLVNENLQIFASILGGHAADLIRTFADPARRELIAIV
jgi:hypothetical protein